MRRSLMRGLAMLGRRHIRVLWVGQFLSSMGDYFYLVAVMWTAAKLAGGAAGLVAAAESTAALAFATLGGVIADRFDRRWAMITADLGRAITVSALALFAFRGGIGIAPMVCAALLLGVFDALFTPALLASIPALVAHPGELQATNGLMDSTRRIARALGPSLAGAVAAIVSTGAFFLIDALSFCASGFALFTMGPAFAWKPERDAPRPSRRGARGVVADVGEGLRLVARHNPVAWGLATLFLTNASWAAGFQVGGVLLVSRELATGIDGYGFLVGAYGVGNVASNLTIGSLHLERRLTTMFTGRVVLGGGFLILASAHSLPVAMAGAALAAFGGPMAELPFVSLLQTEFPMSQSGRVFSLRFMTEHAGVALGLVLAAPLFALVSVRTGILVCAAILIAAGSAGLARFGTTG